MKRGPKPKNLTDTFVGVAMPACPRHLGKEARKEWTRVSRILHRAGLLTQLDRAALALYCTAYERWVEAEMMIRKHGLLTESPNGHWVQNPYLAISNKSLDQLKRLAGELGLTPAARSTIKTPHEHEDSDEDEQMFGPKRAVVG